MISKDEAEHSFKVILVGDSGVGKTNIMRRYITGIIPQTPHPTIGVEFATKIITVGNGVKVKAQIWDTAGQERYKSITSANSYGALLVYDVTKRITFENAKRWADELKFIAGEGIVVVLVGNKLDLVHQNNKNRQVSSEEAYQYAQQNGMIFKESSSFQNENISESFHDLLQAIYERVEQLGDDYGRGTNQGKLIPSLAQEREDQGNCSC